MQWLKLYDRTDLHTECADKYKVREYVEKIVGKEYLIPLLYQTYDLTKMEQKDIPEESCIIKTNHDSSGGIIVRTPTDLDWNEVYEVLDQRLKKNYYYQSREWQYKNILPCVIIEKLLLDNNGGIPYDYKLHCFNGKVEIIQVDTDRFNNHERHLYDKNWTYIDCQWYFTKGEGLVRPKKLNEMIDIAEKLSKKFIFARIDLYEINNLIFFGEITFHPGSGWEFFQPLEFDYKFGKLLNLKNKVR